LTVLWDDSSDDDGGGDEVLLELFSKDMQKEIRQIIKNAAIIFVRHPVLGFSLT
jgi:hypothetical protein